MFENRTYEALLEDVLNNAPEDVDTRQGSIFFDAVSAICMKVAKLYTDLDLVFSLTQLDTTTGEWLDAKASEYGLERQKAIACKYLVSFEGAEPEPGARFFANGLYFTYKEATEEQEGEIVTIQYLECETPGTAGNNVYEGTAAVPMETIEGLSSATFGEIYIPGEEQETDDSLRKRVQEKIAGPAENGNKQHYKTWCESIDGVSKARIFPLWNGPNTVRAALINSLGLPSSPETVQKVQTYIDPNLNGYTVTIDGVTYPVGDGLGEGVANIGAHFTASAATETEIDVEFDATLASGYTKDDAEQEATQAIEEYFKTLALESEDAADVTVRLTAVGAIISGLSSVLDYTDLKLNGESHNIQPGEYGVPVLGEVTVNVV